MPTVTNPETGETKEISMEEFMKRVGEGDGPIGIQQIVTDKEGNKHVTDIYGNMSGMDDGLDRSVNIFCDKEALNAFTYVAIAELKEVTSEDYDENADEGYDPNDQKFVMTIDFTDSTTTCVYTCTEEKVEICFYVRDERKSNTKVVRKSEWKVSEDGHIQITAEDLHNDKTIPFLLAFRQMRRFLRKTGKLAQLKKLDNKSTGVIVYGQGKGENLDAKIVRGKNRPDLPCNVFLLGEQIMRPYPDELMTEMMLSGMSVEDKIAAAEGGGPDCMENLALAYLNGDGVDQNFEKSAYWMEKLAQTGSATGQFNIGLHYAKGCGVKRDFEKAAQWMQKAADQGDEDAPDVAKMYKEMSENLQKAQAGDAKAQAAVAKTYMQIGGSLEQFGPGRDYEEAFQWSKKAADQGDLDAMYYLALCYEHGRGTDKDSAGAAAIYQKAAELGHAPSQWNLAVCYLNGEGRERDEIQGYMWAYQAADQGNELAINGLRHQQKTVEQIIELYKNPETSVTLEGTQYEGRPDRCERLQKGAELTYKITKDKDRKEQLELFYNGGTVGVLSRWNSAPFIALLKLNRVDMKVMVQSCIPKSQRGSRARNADVQLNLMITAKKPETPEERAARLKEERVAAEKARHEAEEAAKRKEAEEKERLAREEAERKRKEEEERRIQEEVQKNLDRDRARSKIAMGMIACSMYHVVAVKPDGTVIAAGKNDHNQCDVSGWRDIVAVDCDEYGTVGLTKDGHVKYTGGSLYKQSSCTTWSGIKQVVMSEECVFGLKEDGTVAATPYMHVNSAAPDVTTWRDIVELRRMGDCTVGIDVNGKAISVNRNYYGRAEKERCYANEGIIDAAVGDYDSVITMKKDGTCGAFSPSQYKPQEIVKIYMLGKRPITILSDGRVIMEEWQIKKEVDRFAAAHASEKMIAVSGSLYMCAFLSEKGRIYIVGGNTLGISKELSTGEPFGEGFQLFDSFTKMMDEKEAAESAAKRRRQEEEAKKAQWRSQGVCQYCGGTLKKGLFSIKCTSCGKKKDY